MLFFAASDFTFTTRHIHSWVSFLLWPSCFILSGVIVLRSSPVAYWTPSDPGDSSFSVISFCLFIQFMRFSQKIYWNSLSVPPPVDHVLSELSTTTLLFWVALHSMAHSFIEFCKLLCHDKAVIHEGNILQYLFPNHPWTDFQLSSLSGANASICLLFYEIICLLFTDTNKYLSPVLLIRLESWCLEFYHFLMKDQDRKNGHWWNSYSECGSE